ncbi:MAG: UDP-N-acetylmuramoyl-L-alanyl-D-glutamate--2,6-diaminopimelate ligase [Firmicutes bacterium]|nr:UDP-N-acetylmuramoyl-L-alanyl-D-glutamate--2,6-diaminopimelate ligase [Bacillota bacterium]
MKLSRLLPECPAEYKDIEITDLVFDSRAVKKGSLYFCIEGTQTDGHEFAAFAAQNGAAALVCSRHTQTNLPHLIVPDVRAALARAAARFYGEPAKKLKLIAVTGTNGKTTTTYIIKSILEAAKKKVGVIGTTAIYIGAERREALLTTPDPTDFHAILADMVGAGVEYVVMEASAHALALSKLEGVVFDAAAFTNFSRDHLDFFNNMENYFNAKKRLFTKKHTKFCVFNADDEKGRELAALCKLPFVTYGCYNPADIFAIRLSMSPDGLAYILNLKDDIADIKFSLPGKFNMYNTLCAAAVTGSLGIPLKHIVAGIKAVKKVDGRFNIINTSKCSIIVDFAHTDDGLSNILSAIREFAPRRVITVFGCGGDRDPSKRPVMGKIVSEKSDYCFITSDNPRNEQPEAIISEIANGVCPSRRTLCRLVSDRKTAIKQAVEFAESGDVVLVAGKGAEQYIETAGGQKIPYNDEQYILSLIEEKTIT